MALHWDLESQTEERANARKAIPDEEYGPLHETIIFGALTVGLRTITEENVGEWYARHAMWSLVNGFDVIPRESIELFIGLRVNVADESRISWLMRVIEPRLNELGGSRDVSEQDSQYMVTIGFGDEDGCGPDELLVDRALRKGIDEVWPEVPEMVKVEQVSRPW